ncbi:N-acetyltransferase [Thalassotalea nanhaiensis]|uniref:N-acetyltransferase n=1 Tax=Thalassotalea nanhaiensis TaxID=3065648 RepID=A0ABY9TNM9_9GAMM|nr:N-acetyltransferase [Colwelliaceae bacterium SQ345]
MRTEQIEDINAISAVTIAAFKDHPHSNQTEQHIVAGLRDNQALSISLVAVYENNIVGHIAFSKVNINNQFCHWYGLAPVSVLPEFQHKGVGSKLINQGLSQLKQQGAQGCVLLGEPEYYGRFGFKAYAELEYPGVPSEYFLTLPFTEQVPCGLVQYHKVFSS